MVEISWHRQETRRQQRKQTSTYSIGRNLPTRHFIAIHFSHAFCSTSNVKKASLTPLLRWFQGIRFNSTVIVAPEVLILARTGIRNASSVTHTNISPLRLMYLPSNTLAFN
jgi:hypothetical protein